MTKDQQLQKRINEIVFPEIGDRLKFGCQLKVWRNFMNDHFDWCDAYVTDVYGGGQIADTGDYSDWNCIVNVDEGWGSTQLNIADFYDDEEQVQIIGLPIDLELLLMAIGLGNCHIQLVPRKNCIRIDPMPSKMIRSYFDWHLGKPYSEQPQETKTAVENLFI